MEIQPQCLQCRHFDGTYRLGYRCEAYVMGIPDAIVHNGHDHRNPYEGDNGIHFEPLEDERAKS